MKEHLLDRHLGVAYPDVTASTPLDDWPLNEYGTRAELFIHHQIIYKVDYLLSAKHTSYCKQLVR